MRFNLVGPFTVNAPFGTEIAFSKGLRQLMPGLHVTEVDPNLGPMQLDRDADATIVFKSCCGREDELKQLNGPVIVYQPDDARFPHIRGMMLQMRQYSDLFLAFDRNSVDVARKLGYSVAEELLLTADPELYRPLPGLDRDIDVSFIGSLGDSIAHASRRKMIETVEGVAKDRGWKTFFAQTQHIPTVVEIYNRSKIVLNHATDVGQQFGSGFGLQCRHFEVGMTKTALLSNQRLGLIGFEKMQFVQFYDERSLISQIEYMLEDDNWSFHANQLYEDIRLNHMPTHRAGQIINFVQRHVLK